MENRKTVVFAFSQKCLHHCWNISKNLSRKPETTGHCNSELDVRMCSVFLRYILR